ncbi:guanine nucleotide-binding protein alpha-2 subunit [Phaffia rhodozyma]|uniref:Guanine nucleotide-binding protein alpha-2 subunit n=1 Tax=Phaffia rhodozyma TaxID=264483 RepID=A0A0F7SHS9_PHARH|nr:guanine nucleotide-binding protein alpha-2 subunit [Phaffia rhodozyma]
MGSCVSSTADSPEAQRSREVERALKEDERKLQTQVKLLLLGAGESGKSTVLKQMRLIHNVPFTSSETEHYRQLIFSNIVHGMRQIIDAMDLWEMRVLDVNRRNVAIIDSAPDLETGQAFPLEYKEPLVSLWNDSEVQRCYERGNEASLPENLVYYFRELDRLFLPDYKPNEQDVVRSRAKTTGIAETTFKIGELNYSMFDVGGQRSERKKWIHCFENVTAILFLVAVSGYDQCLVEDRDSNQMQEALMLFDSICNSQWFLQTSIILFLNKDDLFREKVRGPSLIRDYFPDYQGPPNDYIQGREFFQKKFSRLNRSSTKDVYCHFTCAVDTNMLRAVMVAVTDIILRRSLTELAVL